MRKIIAVMLLMAMAPLAQAQCYNSSYHSSGYGPSYYGNGYYQSYSLTVTSYVYDYPVVPTIVVPAYQLQPALAVQPAVLPAATPTGTQPAIEPVKAVVAPVLSVVYLQPAAVYATAQYSIGYVPIYRTRYSYHK